MTNPEWSDVKKQIVPSEINNNLDLLMAGPIPPNPAELVSRPALEQVLNLLRENYDYVLVDTAPVGLVTDTLQIASMPTSVSICAVQTTLRKPASA